MYLKKIPLKNCNKVTINLTNTFIFQIHLIIICQCFFLKTILLNLTNGRIQVCPSSHILPPLRPKLCHLLLNPWSNWSVSSGPVFSRRRTTSLNSWCPERSCNPEGFWIKRVGTRVTQTTFCFYVVLHFFPCDCFIVFTVYLFVCY